MTGRLTPAQPQLEPLEDVPPHVWVFLLALVCNMFSGAAGFLRLPLSPDRPLLLLALTLMVLDPRTDRLRWRPVHSAMVATLLWTLWSWSSTGSMRDTAKAFALSDRILVPFVMFAVGPLILSTTRRRDLFLQVMSLVGLYLGVTAMFEYAGIDSLVWPSYIADQTLGIQQGRSRGPFLASEPLGMTCALVVFLAGLLAVRRRNIWRWVGLASAAVCIIGASLSLTRSIWLGLALGLITVGLSVPRLRRWTPVAVGGLVSVGFTIAALAPGLAGAFTDRATTERSAYDRILTNDAATRIIEAKPLTGIGWGRFIEVGNDWVRQADTFPLTTTNIEVHNVFLSRAAETGILGAILWGLAVALGPIAVIVRRQQRTGDLAEWRLIAGAAVVIWVFPTLLSPNPYPLPNNLFWLIAGVAGHEWLVRRPSRDSGDHEGSTVRVSTER